MCVCVCVCVIFTVVFTWHIFTVMSTLVSDWCMWKCYMKVSLFCSDLDCSRTSPLLKLQHKDPW